MRWHCSPSYCGAVYSNNNKLADGCEINTNTDNNNCGFCGNPCAMGSTCISGTCVPIVTNGDFETGSFAGWATTGCLTSVASGGGAQHGTHYVSGGCTSNPGDSYQQTISLNVGQMYTLSAWYWGNNAAAGTTFYVGGVALFSSSDSAVGSISRPPSRLRALLKYSVSRCSTSLPLAASTTLWFIELVAYLCTCVARVAMVSDSRY